MSDKFGTDWKAYARELGAENARLRQALEEIISARNHSVQYCPGIIDEIEDIAKAALDVSDD